MGAPAEYVTKPVKNSQASLLCYGLFTIFDLKHLTTYSLSLKQSLSKTMQVYAYFILRFRNLCVYYTASVQDEIFNSQCFTESFVAVQQIFINFTSSIPKASLQIRVCLLINLLIRRN